MGLFNEHSSTTKTDSSSTQGIPGPQGIGYKLDPNGNFDIENKKLTNVQNGDMDKDVMTKSQIEGYVSNKTQYIDNINPGEVKNNKAAIYSNTGSLHSNSLYLKDQYKQEVILHTENQDDNQIRLYIPNLKNYDSFGGRLKSSLVITSLDQIIEGRKVFHNIEVPNPAIDSQACNRAFVLNELSKISDNYVRKSGDAMVGSLIVPKDNYPIQGNLNKVLSYETQREIFLSKREGGKMLQPIDMNGFSIDNLPLPTAVDHASTKGYTDNKVDFKANKSDLNDYMKLDGSKVMTGTLNMNNNRITNLPSPHLSTEPATKDYVTTVMNHLPSLFVDRQGKSSMLGDINMNNHLVKNVKDPVDANDGVNKKYVDTKVNSKADKNDLDKYLDLNGDNLMNGDIRMDGNRITGLSNQPENNYEAPNKQYVDNSIKKAQIKLAHIPDNVLKYIMDDIDQTSSEYGIEIDKIDDYDDSFHSYNKQVIYLKLIKDENDYDGRIGYNIYQLVDKSKNKFYTAAIEWITTDNNAWSKMEIFNNITSGSIISNHTQKFEDGNGIYYTRSIIQFEVFSITTPPVYLLSTIHIEGVNPTYPQKFSEVYNIIYGCNGKLNHIDREVYSKHNAFEIDKNRMKMLVDLDINNKKILNIENITDIKIFGKVNKHIFSTNNIRVYFEKTFIKKIYLYGNDRTNSKNGTLIFLTPGITIPRYRFTFPSDYNEQIVIITINRYFESLRRITLIEFDNLPYIINYNLFY